MALRLLSVLAQFLFVPVYLRAAPEPAMSTKERPKVDLSMVPRQSVSLFERALGNGWRTYYQLDASTVPVVEAPGYLV